LKILVLLCCIFFATLLPSEVISRETLVFSAAASSPHHNENGTGFLDMLEREVLNRIGYDVVFEFLPAERALINSNKGVTDGEAERVKGISKYYTNLIRVDEPIMNWSFVAFTHRSDIVINGWESIQPYSVGLINGWKIFERNTKDALVQTKVKDIHVLFTLLKNKRADLVLIEAWQGLDYLSKHPLANIKMLSPSILEKEQFIYLHKKHANLVPKISSTLKKMKNDGTYQKIFEQVLTPLKR